MTQEVQYENFRTQCISQISQMAMKSRTKLKRESQTFGETGQTDKLLQQKDEEVGKMPKLLYGKMRQRKLCKP